MHGLMFKLPLKVNVIKWSFMMYCSIMQEEWWCGDPKPLKKYLIFLVSDPCMLEGLSVLVESDTNFLYTVLYIVLYCVQYRRKY
jgi:hypothetical protein